MKSEIPARFHLVTFGCQMNRHDSERIAGTLIGAGYREAVEAGDADVVLFNACTVRENAARRLKGQVASLASAKKRRPDLVIGVLGCLAQDEGERLIGELAHVDIVVGTHKLAEIPALIEAVRRARRPVVDVGEDARFAADLPSRRESPSQAWIAITQGCDNHCSYCIVPEVRGPERSRRIEDIERETEALLGDGVLEVTLLGQNVNSYGRDLYGAPRFAELLGRLDRLGVARIRFTTSHPKDFSDEVIDAIASCPGVCEHVHLPAQSGSDRVLALMGRNYTAQGYLERVRRLRQAVPGIAVSTDLMVSFPGETLSEFEETVALVREVGYSQAFTFVYSPRRGTPAAGLEGSVAPEVSRRRMSVLAAAVNESALAFNQGLLGSTQEVLVEGPAKHGAGKLKGRSRGGQTVILDGRDALPHQVVAATIDEAHTWFLMGEVAHDD